MKSSINIFWKLLFFVQEKARRRLPFKLIYYFYPSSHSFGKFGILSNTSTLVLVPIGRLVGESVEKSSQNRAVSKDVMKSRKRFSNIMEATTFSGHLWFFGPVGHSAPSSPRIAVQCCYDITGDKNIIYTERPVLSITSTSGLLCGSVLVFSGI